MHEVVRQKFSLRQIENNVVKGMFADELAKIWRDHHEMTFVHDELVSVVGLIVDEFEVEQEMATKVGVFNNFNFAMS